MNATDKQYFKELSSIDVSDKIEKKNGLSYLSWAYAWAELKKRYPDSTYTIYENKDGLNYHHDGRTAWVKTGVTVLGLEHIEYLPVMDYRNNSIPLDKITSFDVNKAIQRSLTKAVARHGLGLYVYAGEDLPESEGAAPVVTAEKSTAKRTSQATKAKSATPAKPKNEVREEFVNYCKVNGLDINQLCREYHLNNESPDEDFINALNYAHFMVDMRSVQGNENTTTEVN